MDALRAAYPGRIPLHLSNGVAYVWEPEDLQQARTKHNLCGLLSGTLPLIPQQNVFLGLPLRLLPEEVVYLLRHGAALLIDEAQAYDSPTEEERTQFWEREEEKIRQQKMRTLAQQKEQRGKIEAQLHAREGDEALKRRAARQAAKANNVAPSTSAEAGNELGESTCASQEESWERMAYVHDTPGSSAPLPGYRPCTAAMQASRPGARVNTYTSLQDAYAAGVWTYPRTLTERARCAVFEDLHSKGYFLSTGLRFGGDFVVYPGDPLRYHSHYTAAVLETPQTPMPAYHIVAAGRLGTAVKKSHLLCQANTSVIDDAEALVRRKQGADDDANTPWGQVVYWSLAWAGFGT
ncbi:tRNA-intron lyase [Malassezia equina]|uniref:tRNA-splicing endonuclease subunit Sen34 n=1 Tax=Malassezia equina TaxID=1381935 RepID=A0AAF0J1Y9_9BASI|nr:tRNA-intron lyase [Malassezia equina]